MPKLEIVKIVLMNPNVVVSKVIEFFLSEPQFRIQFNLSLDFIHHFLCKVNFLISALECPVSSLAIVLMEDCLAH